MNKIKKLKIRSYKINPIIFIAVFASVGVGLTFLVNAASGTTFQMQPNFDAQSTSQFTSQPGIQAVQQSQEGRVTTENNVAGKAKAVRFKIKYPTDNGVAMSRPSGCSVGQGCAYGERSELRLSDAATNAYEGNDTWWGWRIYIPPNFPTSPDSVSFNIITQLHGSSGSPPFALGFVNSGGSNKLQLELRGGAVNQNRRVYNLGSLKTDHWYTFVTHTKWSSGSNALMEVWVDKDINSSPTVTDVQPNRYSGGGHYLKMGIYRGSHKPDTKESTLYHADWIVTDSKASVASALGLSGGSSSGGSGGSGSTGGGTPTPSEPELADITQPNLLNGKVISTETQINSNQRTNINDKNKDTRWISENSANTETITADLGANYNLSSTQISWAAKTTKNYTVQASSNGQSWSTLISSEVPVYQASSTTKSYKATHALSAQNVRYIRIQATSLHTVFNPDNIGHSLYEWGVYGSAYVPSADPAPTTPENPDPSTDPEPQPSNNGGKELSEPPAAVMKKDKKNKKITVRVPTTTAENVESYTVEVDGQTIEGRLLQPDEEVEIDTSKLPEGENIITTTFFDDTGSVVDEQKESIFVDNIPYLQEVFYHNRLPIAVAVAFSGISGYLLIAGGSKLQTLPKLFRRI